MPTDVAKIENELMILIKTKVPKDQVNTVSGLYRFMAKVAAIENCLLKKKIIDRQALSVELKSIYEFMKKDFEK